MTKLFCYVIDHHGDPKLEKDELILGWRKCAKLIRPYANTGDWIVATLGRNFGKKQQLWEYSDIAKYRDYWKYIVYAMKVTAIKEDSEKRILISTNFGYFCPPIYIPQEFQKFIKRGQGKTKFPRANNKIEDDELINSFEKWITEKKITEPKLSDSKKIQESLCKPSC